MIGKVYKYYKDDPVVSTFPMVMSAARSRRLQLERTGGFDTDDLCQEGFLAVMASTKNFDPDYDEDANLSGFARSSVQWRINDKLGKGKQWKHTPLYDPMSDDETTQLPDALNGGVDPESVIAWRELVQIVVDAIASLSEIQRNVIQWHFGDGLKFVEIAKQKQIPMGTVNCACYRAMRNLRSLLGPDVLNEIRVLMA